MSGPKSRPAWPPPYKSSLRHPTQRGQASRRCPGAIRAELSDSHSATALRITAKSDAPVLALCRKLVDAGHDPSTALEAFRGDVLCLRIKSIGQGARLRIGTNGSGNAKTHGWKLKS